MSVFILRIGLCATDVIPCLGSKAKASSFIIFVSIRKMMGRTEDFLCPRRCPAHWSCLRRWPRPFPKEVLSSERQGKVPILVPRGQTFGMHRILVHS